MDLDQTEDTTMNLVTTTCSTALDSTTNSSGNGDKYLTVRRHTVGPGDPAHEQVNK